MTMAEAARNRAEEDAVRSSTGHTRRQLETMVLVLTLTPPAPAAADDDSGHPPHDRRALPRLDWSPWERHAHVPEAILVLRSATGSGFPRSSFFNHAGAPGHLQRIGTLSVRDVEPFRLHLGKGPDRDQPKSSNTNDPHRRPGLSPRGRWLLGRGWHLFPVLRAVSSHFFHWLAAVITCKKIIGIRYAGPPRDRPGRWRRCCPCWPWSSTTERPVRVVRGACARRLVQAADLSPASTS
jgi:hypothetical protein